MFLICLSSIFLLNACQNTEDETQKTGSLAPKKEGERQSMESQPFDDPFALESEQFNDIETVNGDMEIQNPDNVQVLVNSEYTLPEDYEPDDLAAPDVSFSFDEDIAQRYVREPAAEALENLFEDASESGHKLFAISGYRSYERQETLFTAAAEEEGEETASETLAAPGNSEHQTGLAMDVSSESNNFQLNTAFANTDEGEWLDDHAHEHGFIIRYPEGKEEITGISYEPWHLRYVGEEIAEVLHENDLTLEEFFEQTEQI